MSSDLTGVCRGCSVLRAHKTSFRSILFSICSSLLRPSYWKTRRLWGRGCDDAKPRENNRLFSHGETDSHENFVPVSTYLLACFRLSDSRNDAYVWGTQKYERVIWEKGAVGPSLSPVSSRFIFVFALSQFRRPDYLEAWNRLPTFHLILRS